MLTAHDKFNDIIEEAQKGDSIFKAGNVIKVEEIAPEQTTYTQLTIEPLTDTTLDKAYEHTQLPKTDATDSLSKKAVGNHQYGGFPLHSAHTEPHCYSSTGTADCGDGQA